MEKLLFLLSELVDEALKEKVLFLVSTIAIGLFINIIGAAIVRFIFRW